VQEEAKKNADFLDRIDALAAATSTLSVDAQKRAEKDAMKKAQKAEAAEAKAARTLYLSLYIKLLRMPPLRLVCHHRNHSIFQSNHQTGRAQ